MSFYVTVQAPEVRRTCIDTFLFDNGIIRAGQLPQQFHISTVCTIFYLQKYQVLDVLVTGIIT